MVLKVNAGAYCIESANPRHGHEWKVWRDDVKLPDGKILIPGVIDSTTNFVEHPELVAEADHQIRGTSSAKRTSSLGRTADLARGRSRTWSIHQWSGQKLRALADGAAIASDRLWGRSKAAREAAQ
jgi:5-methyltetrahydropteroyltriglutamate--homocysteine methyltransferase